VYLCTQVYQVFFTQVFLVTALKSSIQSNSYMYWLSSNM